MERTDNNNINWNTDTLPRATQVALNDFSRQDWLKQSDWYLAGGTALALHAGHRKSVDLDFFTPQKDFSLEDFLTRFTDNSHWETTIARKGTIYGLFHRAKISFIAYPFFNAAAEPSWYGTVRVLSPRDIAVMKIIAISQRGRKRDFVDLYWYVKNQEPLIDILQRVPDQYATTSHNWHHILKSLVYFTDAESDPMPQLYFDATWPEIKKYFQTEVPPLARRMLGIE